LGFARVSALQKIVGADRPKIHGASLLTKVLSGSKKRCAAAVAAAQRVS